MVGVKDQANREDRISWWLGSARKTHKAFPYGVKLKLLYHLAICLSLPHAGQS